MITTINSHRGPVYVYISTVYRLTHVCVCIIHVNEQVDLHYHELLVHALSLFSLAQYTVYCEPVSQCSYHSH